MVQLTYTPPAATMRTTWQLRPRQPPGNSITRHSFYPSLPQKPRKLLGTLTGAVQHLAAAFLHFYVEEGISVHTIPPWSSRALETTIPKGTNASACNPETVRFIWGEMQRRIQDGFSILLPGADAVRLFGGKIKLFRIVAVSEVHFQPRLILNLSDKPDKGAPSVNDTTDRQIALESMKFWRVLHRILQAV